MKSRDEYVVYKITNTINNKIYIGSAKYFARRKGEHYYMWRNNNHSNQHLQNSYSKYGDVFKFEILEYCKPENLVEKEQYYIDTLKPDYNILKKAYSSLGYKHSEKTKVILSKKFKGMKRILGRVLNKESKRKQAIAKSKTVLQFDSDMNFIKEWESAKVAAESLFNKTGRSTGIRDCIRGRTKKAFGFKWKDKKSFELQRIKENEKR